MRQVLRLHHVLLSRQGHRPWAVATSCGKRLYCNALNKTLDGLYSNEGSQSYAHTVRTFGRLMLWLSCHASHKGVTVPRRLVHARGFVMLYFSIFRIGMQ